MNHRGDNSKREALVPPLTSASRLTADRNSRGERITLAVASSLIFTYLADGMEKRREDDTDEIIMMPSWWPN